MQHTSAGMDLLTVRASFIKAYLTPTIITTSFRWLDLHAHIHHVILSEKIKFTHNRWQLRTHASLSSSQVRSKHVAQIASDERIDP